MRAELEALIAETDDKLKSAKNKQIEAAGINLRERCAKGDEKARTAMVNLICEQLEARRGELEESINSLITGYTINFFQNVYTGDYSSGRLSGADEEIWRYFEKFRLPHDSVFEDKLRKLAEIVHAELYGYGIVDFLVFDGGFDEVGINRHDYIWVQYKGIKRRIPNKVFRFESEEKCRKIIEDRLTSAADQEMNAGTPIIYAVLLNGSRVTAVRPPLSRYHAVSIRTFKKTDINAEIKDRFIPQKVKDLLALLVRKGRRNVAVIGEQGSGKTTLADAIIEMFDPHLSIGLAENVHELDTSRKYSERNVIELQYGKEYTPSDIIEMFFRFNRDVVILGEVRNPMEAFEMIKAMLRQARGSLFTFHTSSVERMIHDLRQLLMQTGFYSDYREARFDVADAVDICIHIKLDRETGERYIYRVAEIDASPEDMSYGIKDLFRYDKVRGIYLASRTGISRGMEKSCLEYEMTHDDVEKLREIFTVAAEEVGRYGYLDAN